MSQASGISRRYLAREAVLLIGFCYLLIFGATSSGLLRKETLFINAALVTLLSGWWVLSGARTKSTLQWKIFLFLAVLLLAAWQGVDPSRSLPEVWLIAVGFFLLLFIIELVGRGWQAELIIKALLLTGAVVSFFAWMGVLQWYMAWLQAAPGEWLPSVSYRLPAANMMAVLLNLLLMSCLGRLFAATSRSERIPLILYALSTLGLLYLTSSRSGWLGTAAGLGVMALLHGKALLCLGKKLLHLLKRQRWLWGLLIPLVLVVLAFGGYMLYKQATHPSHASIFSARAEFWPPAWKAFTSSPWLGSGPFTFSNYYLQANSTPPRLLFIYAHNLYLDVLHGSGLLGMAAFLLLVVALLRELFLRLKQASGETRAVVVGALAALAAFGVHGVFDSVHHTEPLCAMMLAILLGAALGIPLPGRAAPEKKAFRLTHFRPLWGLLLTAFAWLHLWQVQPFYAGAAAADNGDWAEAVAQYREASRRNPGMAAASQQLGISLAMLAQSEPQLLPEALAALVKTEQLDPTYALHSANVGMLYLQTGEPIEAINHLLEAVEKAPDAALYQLALGAAAEESGEILLAETSYHKALSLETRWQTLDFWSGSDLRHRALADWQAQQPDAQMSVAELEQQLSTNPDEPKPYLELAAALLDSGDLERCEQVLVRAHFAYFIDTQDYLDLLKLEARLARLQGDVEIAQELEERVEYAETEWGVYGAGAYGMRLYAPYVYRVPGMKLEWLGSSLGLAP